MTSVLSVEEFVKRAHAAFPVGYAFANLGRGTTRIEAHSSGHVWYRRGSSTIRVPWGALYAAYAAFAGKRMSSADLREFRPHVFDSLARPAGHSCNCTFLIQLLMGMGLVDGGIQGRGVRGDPYAVLVATADR